MKSLDEWIKTDLPQVANKLEEKLVSVYNIESDEEITVAGRDELFKTLDTILAALFPGTYSKFPVAGNKLNKYVTDILAIICKDLYHKIYPILIYRRSQNNCAPDCSCEEQAREASIEFVKSLPEIRETLIADIKSGHEGDPASKSYHEIILSYPYIEAVATHRIAHKLYSLNVPLIPRVMSERAHSRTGIDIHPGATIGKGFFIDHGTGVVIGETCRIGNNVTIYHGVTLGAFSPYDRENNRFQGKKRHPDVEDDVVIYSGAVILGGETIIGKGSVIGGNALITKSIAPYSQVYRKTETTVYKSVLKHSDGYYYYEI
ncbi:MAG: serine acetyltransferase [Chitinivibrionia bacterium]|nr:serine acetyltransferase [Chitinivibrionia bacterium]